MATSLQVGWHDADDRERLLRVRDRPAEDAFIPAKVAAESRPNP